MRVNTVPSNCSAAAPSASPEPYHINDLGCPPTQEPSPTEDICDRPHDRREVYGGWLLGVAASVVAVLVPHLSLCHGMVATYVRRAFPSASWTAVAGLYAAMLASWNLTGPITHVLLLGFSFRSIALVGSLLVVSGLSLSFFIPNMATLYVTLGIMTGCGASLLENVNGKMLQRFFRTRSDLLSRACLVFRCVCQALLPQFLFFLLDIYGLRGALLVLGGITLNVFASALTFPPRKSHALCPCKGTGEEATATTTTFRFRKHKAADSSNSVAAKKKRRKKKKRKRKKSVGDKDLSEDRRWKNPSYDQPMGMYLRGHRLRTISLDSSRMLPDIPEEQEPIDDEDEEEEEDEDDDDDDEECASSKAQDCQLLTSNDSNSVSEGTRRVRQESIASTVSYSSSGEWGSQKTSLSVSSSSLYSESTLSITSSVYSGSLSEVGSTLSLYADREDVAPGEASEQVLLWNTSDLALLARDPVLWILVLSFTLSTLVSSSVLLYVPEQMVRFDMKPARIVACLLSLHVVTNIGGRVSLFWTLARVGRPLLLFLITSFCVLISVGGLIFVDHFPFLAVCMTVFSWSSGATNALMPAVVLCTLGEGSHGAVATVLNLAQAAAFVVGSPLLGFLLERSGNLSTLFAILMTLQAVAIIVWTFQSVAERCSRGPQAADVDDDIPDV